MQNQEMLHCLMTDRNVMATAAYNCMDGLQALAGKVSKGLIGTWERMVQRPKYTL